MGWQVWELKDLGLQAAQRVVAAGDPLRLLADISQNFPSLVAPLTRMAVNASLRAEATGNARFLAPGVTLALLNGMPLDASSPDLYRLLDQIRSEVGSSICALHYMHSTSVF